MLGLFAVTATTTRPATEMQAALSGVFMQIFNHGITAAALFYYVGLLEQRRGLRGINDFGGLMQRTPLLCGWMSVAMFSSLGLPGLNGFIGEFLIFKGSFAVAASYTAVAVLGLLVTAIVFMRAMQALFSGPLTESCSAFRSVAVRGSRSATPSRNASRSGPSSEPATSQSDGSSRCASRSHNRLASSPIAGTSPSNADR
jgi:NADH-quinone oxidoreductase subunit M